MVGSPSSASRVDRSSSAIIVAHCTPFSDLYDAARDPGVMNRRADEHKAIIGWREWVQLPDLGVTEMKVKVDTGADNSSLHAFNLERFERDGTEYVRFEIHPKQRSRKPSIQCEAPLAMEKKVKNPGGRSELRPVIRTRVLVAGLELNALVNLTSRDEMGFRMLLGRRAVRSKFVIDPGRSYLGARPGREQENE
jgi:hypothetical protein